MSNPFRLSILICAMLSTASAQDAAPETARQITHAIFDSPSLSPDGRQMVYVNGGGGREQLFIRSLDGTTVRLLTADSVDHEDPAWSPDGVQIAFVSLTSTTEQIAIVPAAGGALDILTPATERCIHPAWLPDGKHLGYCTDDDLAPPRKNDSDIKIFDLATRKSRVLITGGVNTYPVWSPDGRSIAFRRILDGTNSEIFVADSDGTNAHNVTNSPAFDGWPAWSPDGQRLAFASNRDGDYQIHVMDADGSHVQLVARTSGRATEPKWSPDGRTLFFPICRRVDGGFDCNIFEAKAHTPPRK